ncbi:ImmA/IrrE family metallo-endopeptidase [Paenibacillus psychroresistens]|uniref:ImmA/IrrE family metallo-endopeptidase n=1 Tax=Paenibacillus psychroresistens TaxID=1778678 RepID=A0A6B8RJQ0_9BACL|nr:ImmA/IrrE family metallo-endopeptidase [Paenibacillus psychroresistens]QGQ95812.1 ImmA/IrrE family metallo-endopeptidase [Paenibacillus psychroresistens]
MQLNLYKPTDLEQWITLQYQQNGIHYASDLDIEKIASIFNTTVMTSKGPSHVQWDDEFCVIFINGYHREETKREMFFHELCHPIRHEGNQNKMPTSFIELQEIQASIFQLYAAMPAYMLEEFKNIQGPVHTKVLAEEFRLSEQFIIRRLEQINQRILREQQDELYRASRRRTSKPPEYTEETKRILNQLYRQIKHKLQLEA